MSSQAGLEQVADCEDPVSSADRRTRRDNGCEVKLAHNHGNVGETIPILFFGHTAVEELLTRSFRNGPAAGSVIPHPRNENRNAKRPVNPLASLVACWDRELIRTSKTHSSLPLSVSGRAYIACIHSR